MLQFSSDSTLAALPDAPTHTPIPTLRCDKVAHLLISHSTAGPQQVHQYVRDVCINELLKLTFPYLYVAGIIQVYFDGLEVPSLPVTREQPSVA